MAFLRDSWRLFALNARTVLLIEVAVRALFPLVLAPLCFALVDLALAASGLTYVADTNLSVLLRSPATWLLALAVVLIATFGALFEMCALVAIMQAGRAARRIGLVEAVRCGLLEAVRVVHPRNWLMAPFALLLVPLTNVVVVSSVVAKVRLPEFIVEFVAANGALSAALALITVAFYVHAFFLAFGVHFFVLRREPWMRARRSSRELLRGNAWCLLRRLGLMFALTLLATVVLALFLGLASFSIAEETGDISLGTALVGAAVVLGATLADCLFVSFSYAALSCTFYELVENRGIPVTYRFAPAPSPARARIAACALACAVILSVGVSAAWQAQRSGSLEPALSSDKKLVVTAHRGGAFTAPENTLAAFERAIEQGADWIELDVQQTADGVLVVMHDSSLKRTTGVDRECRDLTYAEIARLDNGSWFDPAFAGERVCTLEEALSLCKGKVRVNVEVKPDGHGGDLERKTVEVVNACGMRDQVAIASISYDSLARVKEVDPTMPTLFNMTIAYGRISDIECVDYFSVDDFFVTQSLVNDVHRAGKTIYAWTVNDPSNMLRLAACGVDGLVTDDVAQARALADNGAPEGF